MAAIPVPAIHFAGKHAYIGFYHGFFTFSKDYPVKQAHDQDNDVDYKVKVVYPKGMNVSHWMILRLTAIKDKKKETTTIPETGSLTWTYTTPQPPNPPLAGPFTANTVAVTDDDQA
jgi:hypothetical protein